MKYLTFLAIVLLCSSCEKAFFEKKLETTHPFENFEYLWNECNEKYAYFELKQVDWNAVKIEYERKLFEGMSDDSLFHVLGDMLTELKDGHTSLKSNFNIKGFEPWYVGQDNFEWRVILDHYLNNEVYATGPFDHNFINSEIGYVRLSAFTSDIGPSNLDFILNRYKNTKGLILDLRENGGGDISGMFKVLGRFIDEKTIIAYARSKSGKGHNDFSESIPVDVTPYDGIRYKNKVALLIDRGTFSAASFTSLSSKALPNVILIGDTTGGGTGAPNGGQLPNGWVYRFSVSQALTLDLRPDYENGVPPDVQVLFDWNDLTKDEVIERAIIELQ